MDESNNGEGEDGDEEAHADFSEGGEFNELPESGVDEKSKEGNESENQNGVDRLNLRGKPIDHKMPIHILRLEDP